jgi:hypothetical protein
MRSFDWISLKFTGVFVKVAAFNITVEYGSNKFLRKSVHLYQTTRSQDLEDSFFKYVFNYIKICVHDLYCSPDPLVIHT